MLELQQVLKLMVRLSASDAFITAEAPISLKINGLIRAVDKQVLSPENSRDFCYSMMNEMRAEEFDEEREANFAIEMEGLGRFRVNIFMQRGAVGAVLRRINTTIPSFKDLKLPEIIPKLTMTRQGLIIVVGGTGTGKSTTLASMISYRNARSSDHIVTVEDPIEYVYSHRKSLITQREVGLDTKSFEAALKNALRQAPDVVSIGEVRDHDSMHNALVFAETGHLCMATLHANNAFQALDRVINFFPADRRDQLLMDLSLNLTAMISQRLVPTVDGQGRVAVIEIMVNTPLISDHIRHGRIDQIREAMLRSQEAGNQTFDQSIYERFTSGYISAENALRFADSENDMRLRLKYNTEDGLDTSFDSSQQLDTGLMGD